ncbi:hypothetical protein HT136_23225 [Novosphingobium profundi]|uniref:hypothetical protein n=1 Tax=Novosphingobium profundi TaxID=1774954 RepID=UPI001BDA3349|nr:hypothetical protein [Novosphingobium profundi]MBT0671287.1 hypothetical protein [Novosphingobium profundi]
MTSSKTFTAKITFPLTVVPTVMFQNVQCLADDYLTEKNREVILEKLISIEEWLRLNGRQSDLVMTYDNSDHTKGQGELSVVLNERDTALLLKLAQL